MSTIHVNASGRKSEAKNQTYQMHVGSIVILCLQVVYSPIRVAFV